MNINQTNNSFKAYFEGLPPYPEVKSRKDIPDSFIYETTKEILKSVDTLHFIVEDGNLRKAVNSLKNGITYDSLEKFVESKIYQDVLKEKVTDEKFEKIKDLLKGFSVDLKYFLEYNIENELHGKTFTDFEIPDDNNEATITGAYEPDQIKIFYDLAKYYGDGFVIVPFELGLEALVDYFIFKSDYYTMDNERASHISISDHNDHYFWAEEYLYLKVLGNISVPTDIDLLVSEEKINIFDLDKLKIDSIEEIEVN